MDILEVRAGTPLRSGSANAWQDVHLQTAYQAGIQQAAFNLCSEGARVEPSWLQGTFLRTLHAESAGLIYRRAYGKKSVAAHPHFVFVR